MLEHFYMRKAICKLRLTAHNLLIETGRYVKPKNMPRSERICKNCNLNIIENEFHFVSLIVPRRYFFCGSFMFLFFVRVCLYVLCGHLLGKG